VRPAIPIHGLPPVSPPYLSRASPDNAQRSCLVPQNVAASGTAFRRDGRCGGDPERGAWRLIGAGGCQRSRAVSEKKTPAGGHRGFRTGDRGMGGHPIKSPLDRASLRQRDGGTRPRGPDQPERGGQAYRRKPGSARHANRIKRAGGLRREALSFSVPHPNVLGGQPEHGREREACIRPLVSHSAVARAPVPGELPPDNGLRQPAGPSGCFTG
jgi:hypothetical protein